MSKMGSLGKAKIGSAVEKIYWIEKVGGRGRRESLRDGAGIEVRGEYGVNVVSIVGVVRRRVGWRCFFQDEKDNMSIILY